MNNTGCEEKKSRTYNSYSLAFKLLQNPKKSNPGNQYNQFNPESDKIRAPKAQRIKKPVTDASAREKRLYEVSGR